MQGVLVTPPAVEPVTLAEAKLWIKVDHDDEDALISSLITAARTAAEDYTRRAFITQTWKLTLDSSGGGSVPDWLPAGTYDLPVNYFSGDIPTALVLPRQPVQTITSISTYDTDGTGTVFAPANYTISGTRLVINEYWPSNLRTYGGAEITYVCGYGAAASSVPEPIKTAIKMHVQLMYDDRTACDLPAPCERLLRQYRVLSL